MIKEDRNDQVELESIQHEQLKDQQNWKKTRSSKFLPLSG
jgi:hypothetical protein